MEASGGLPAVTLHSLSPDIFTQELYYIDTDPTAVRLRQAVCTGRGFDRVRTGTQPMSLWGSKGVPQS